MSGFTSVDDIIAAETVTPKAQQLWFNKLVAQATIANTAHTLWKALGTPSPGSDPTLGMAGAVTLTSATIGAIPFTNAAAGKFMNLLSQTALANGIGCLILVDRIASAQITNAQATASFSPVLDATSRLGATEGGYIVAEVTSPLSAASNTRTFTYTNQAGTSGQVSGSLVTLASAVAGRCPQTSSIFIPLASGDSGVRSIQSTTLVSGTATGQMDISIVRPLAMIGIDQIGVSKDLSYVFDNPSLPRIYDNSCLMFYWIAGAAVSPTFFSQLTICEN